MRIVECLARRTRPLISLEITPPEKGSSIQGIYDTIEQLLPYHPAFINVTYHQQRIVYEDLGNGMIRKVPRRKNPGTVGICAAIYNRYKIETVPHIICGGFNKYDTEDALIDLHFLGFKNLFVLRGDPAPGFKEFVPEPDGWRYASELVAQIARMNSGRFLEKLENAVPTNFSMGVAGYPEKHYEAPNLVEDLKHLKEKVDAGAEYVISQMVFSARAFRGFVERARSIGIRVPIIPGVKAVVSSRQLQTIPREFHVDLPDELVACIQRAAAPADAFRVGTEFTIRLCRELLKQDVPGIHYYTMGRARDVVEVLKAIT